MADGDRNDTLLTTDGALATTALAAPGDGGADPALARRRIGRYELVRSLGAGGMGVVWEAIDPELGRRVAIKLMREERSARLAERMKREAQALAQLHHPNVVAVYDVGLDDGELYLVMQLVVGATIDRVLEASTLTRGEIVALVAQAGRGLAAAHRAGIVHRDFKPSNVLVDGDGVARVSDFGLARASDAGGGGAGGVADGSLDASITRGDLVGTPAYMAPEQFLGGPITAATDQFAFCVTLWEALAGERPFAGASVDEVREAVIAGRMRELPARIPRRARSVLLRGLARAPADRFASMDELLAELAPDRRLLWIAGGVGIAAVAAAVTLLGAPREAAPSPCEGIDASLLAGAWDAPIREQLRAALARDGHPRGQDAFGRVAAIFDRYAAGWVTMRAQACAATHVRNDQSPALLDLRTFCLDDRAAQLGATARALAQGAHPDKADAAIAAALAVPSLDDCANRDRLLSVVPPPVEPIARARAAALSTRLADGEALFELGRFDDARAAVTAALADARDLGYAPLIARALVLRGSIEARGGDVTSAPATLHEAAEHAARGKDDALVARSYTAIILALRAARKLDEALALAPFGRAAVARAGDDPMLLAMFEASLAAAYRELGRLDEASARIEAALRRLPDGAPGRRGDFLTSHATLLRYRGQHDASLAALREAVAIYERVFGPESYKLATALYNLSRQYAQLERCDDARRAQDRSLAISTKLIGPDHQDLILDYITMGDQASHCGKDLDRARAGYTKAVALAEAKQPTMLPLALGSYGWGLLQLDRAAEAEPLLVRGLALAEAANDRVVIANQSRDLGQARLELGRPHEALALLERAGAIFEAAPAPVEHAAVLTLLARARLASGRVRPAIAAAEQALALALAHMPAAARAPQFVLARALWEGGGDRTRALELAVAAEVGYAARGPDATRDEVRAWLRAHAP